MVMSDIFFPPSVPTDAAIERVLADRVDACRLSLGMAVGITDSRHRRYVAHGSQNAASGRPVDRHTLFEIGSVTKLFTSLLLADMVIRREAELDEPVANLLPSGVRVPERDGRQITLVDLAKHLSGLPRLPTNLTPNDPADPYAHYTAQHLYDFLARDELLRTPGDAVEYSNLGAGLLGHALCLRAGMDYESLVTRAHSRAARHGQHCDRHPAASRITSGAGARRQSRSGSGLEPECPYGSRRPALLRIRPARVPRNGNGPRGIAAWPCGCLACRPA